MDFSSSIVFHDVSKPIIDAISEIHENKYGIYESFFRENDETCIQCSMTVIDGTNDVLISANNKEDCEAMYDRLKKIKDVSNENLDKSMLFFVRDSNLRLRISVGSQDMFDRDIPILPNSFYGLFENNKNVMYMENRYHNFPFRPSDIVCKMPVIDIIGVDLRKFMLSEIVDVLKDTKEPFYVNEKTNHIAPHFRIAASNSLALKDVYNFMFDDLKCGNTKFHVDVWNGKIDEVNQYLKENPTIVMSANEWGYIPLHLAVLKNDVELASILCDHMDVESLNTVTNFDETCLHLAAKWGHYDALKLLITRVNTSILYAIDKDEAIFLKHLLKDESVGLLEELLLKGPCSNAHNYIEVYDQFVRSAKSLENQDIIDVIVRSYLKDKKAKLNLMLLEIAITRASFAVVREFIGRYMREYASQCEKTGETMLHWLVKNGYLELIKQVTASLSINDWIFGQTDKEETLLQWASKHNQMGIAEWILFRKSMEHDDRELDSHSVDRSCDMMKKQIYHVNKEGSNLFHCMAANGNVAFLKKVALTVQTRLDMQTKNGSTVMHLAAKNKQVETAKWLLSIKPYDYDKYSSKEFTPTPLHIVAENGCLEIANLLVQNAPQSYIECVEKRQKSSALYTATFHGHYELLCLLLGYCSLEHRYKQVELYTNCSWSPIHVACVKGYVKCLNKLLEDVPPEPREYVSNMGTILNIACSKGNLEMVKTIIDGANPSIVSIPNTQGLFPMWHVARKGFTDILRVLVEAFGIEVTFLTKSKGDESNSAMEVALHFGCAESIVVLIELQSKFSMNSSAPRTSSIHSFLFHSSRSYKDDQRDAVFFALTKQLGWTSYSTDLREEQEHLPVFVDCIGTLWSNQCSRALWLLDITYMKGWSIFWSNDTVVKDIMKWIDTIPWQ